ncbi:pitrilysin family protein [Dickeya chrysanthemi]|uniref:M16 family metallopeptidase n=1 Tax=Dickeya chrysanthemi TaxID=556 RepID=UPI001CF227ED|nr:M16 family metallopeptidase [Dickeya chrysanthemi]MCA7009331.1 insulinase family protein [Dickeya chrysanthemi]
MRKMTSRWIGIIGFCLFSTLASAQTVTSPLPVITEGQLDNGLRYTIVPLSGQQQRLDIRLLVESGSLDEQDGESGVAHMVEHMVFRATRDYPAGLAKTLGQQGWIRGQHYNAMTNYERTVYMLSPPAGKPSLGLALNVLAQIAGHARFEPEDWQRERQVILEEWRGKLGVAERMNQQRVAAIRHGSRYPDRPVIGTEASIQNTPVTVLHRFYDRWYHPRNMRLMVIGDLQPEQVKQAISQAMGNLPDTPIPARESYEPALRQQLHVVRLQDSQSSVSQISFVFRFDDAAAKATGEEGMRRRLINQVTLDALSKQVQRQPLSSSPAVSSLVVRKSDIGNTTVALGLFASVLPDGHQQGVNAVLQEIARLQRYPLHEPDIIAIKETLRQSAEKLAATPEQREFSDWVRQWVTSWEQDRPYIGKQQVAQQALAVLKTITTDDINACLQRWLSSPDQLVQFSVPGSLPFTLPSAAAIEQQRQLAAQSELAPLQPPVARVTPVLPPAEGHGEVTAVRPFPQQKVEEWQLANGDRLVWLRTPQAGKTVSLTVLSPAGFMAPGREPWLSQLAAQLFSKSGPAGWKGRDLNEWEKARKLALSLDYQPDELRWSGSVSPDKLEALLHLYHVMNRSAGIDEGDLRESLAELKRQQVTREQSISELRERESAELQFGKTGMPFPTPEQLDAVTREQLTQQWRQTVAAPVTYYLLADLPADQLRPLVERYLASLPRQAGGESPQHLALEGKRERISAINLEPRADVYLWSFSPQTWTPQQAVQVNIASRLAARYLKASLRDDAQGIYNLKMESRLNDKSQRIETVLRFTTSPQRVQELRRNAQQVLETLATRIMPQDVEQERKQFIHSERARQQDSTTLMSRLILSYRHYHDPRYLTQLDSLVPAITFDAVRDAASRLWHPQNQVLYITLPQEKKS